MYIPAAEVANDHTRTAIQIIRCTDTGVLSQSIIVSNGLCCIHVEKILDRKRKNTSIPANMEVPKRPSHFNSADICCEFTYWCWPSPPHKRQGLRPIFGVIKDKVIAHDLQMGLLALVRGAEPRCSDFWRPGETGAVA
jgi:hypothetical protein